MLHRPVPLRRTSVALAKSELEAVGLSDPTVTLHQSALRDFYIITMIFIGAFIVASSNDLGDWYLVAVTRHADWELDEVAMAAIFTLIAFCWLAFRQWRRYADEITRRIRLEEEIMEMRVMADQFGLNKPVFLANLEHDLRTPLNGILGFVQLLEEEPFGPIGSDHYKKYVRSIRESAAMLDDRITTCLDPDKVEFGAEPMQMKPWPIKDLVASAIPIVRPVAESARIRIDLDLAADLPDVHADERAIKKILINLVTNAIKFSRPKGFVRIAAKLTTDKALALIVEDNGIGITKDDLDPRWTHPQYSNVHADPGVKYGMGIGLSVVRTLLEKHDATFDIRSVPNKGTTVTMIFPPTRLVQKGSLQKTMDQASAAE